MVHYINIHNMSGHDQEFEVHGWNNNKNITVKANSTAVIPAPDKTSGAIIALHDGHEGEQAEITKDGFEGKFQPFSWDHFAHTVSIGNDFIDISNIVGSGGNMTVMQVGDISTLKGDSLFMQDMNKAWHKASQQTRDKLKDLVHLNGQGHVVRIDAIKGHPDLEALVRTFADGKTYVGVGAWGGSLGHPGDNAQSSAAHGDKDILITYSDGDAYPHSSPKGHPAELAHRPVAKMVVQYV